MAAFLFYKTVVGWVDVVVNAILPTYVGMKEKLDVSDRDVVAFLLLSYILYRTAVVTFRFMELASRVQRWLVSLWSTLYLLCYARKAEVVYTVQQPFKYYEVPDADIVKEAAYSNGQLINREGTPEGTFQVLIRNEDGSYVLIGHGFVLNGVLYTAAHVAILSDELYVASPTKRGVVIPVVVDAETVDHDADICVLRGKAVAAALGLKSLKAALPRHAPVVVYTRDGDNYVAQHVQPLPYAEYPVARALATRSTTIPSDSGMPIFQNGKVVAMHIGANIKYRVNVHHMLSNLLASELRVRLARYRPVLSGITVESPAVGNGEDDDRWIYIARQEVQ